MAMQIEIEGKSIEIQRYISTKKNAIVDVIILYSNVEIDEYDFILGAYYGNVGSGVLDGGYFRIDYDSDETSALDYEEIEELANTNPVQHSILEKLMRSLWTLVEEIDEELMLTKAGKEFFSSKRGKVCMDDDFLGDDLEGVSDLWKLPLRFIA